MSNRTWLLWSVGAGLLGGLVALFVRHPFPIDETRYLAVAWEMHWRDVWLMPLLEGEPYVQKPPLLFWLIRLGWLVFDVNAWWPRLLIVFFALGVLWAVAALMRRLTVRSSEKLEQGVPKVPAVPWGEPLRTAPAPWLAAAALSGFIAWPAWSSALYFDVPLTFFVVLGALMLLRLAETGRGGGWLALAAGLGALMKGPLVAVPFVGLVLGLPWWASHLPWRDRWRTVARAVGWGMVGALLPLAWLAAVYWRNGAETFWAVLEAQGIGRLGAGADHAAPWWWYLPVIIAMVWPLGWRGVLWKGATRASRQWGLRFVVAAVAPGVVLLSLIAGKRAQYVLPFLPFLAVAFAFAAHAVQHETNEREKRDAAFAAIRHFVLVLPLAAAALVLMVAPWVPRWEETVAWLTPRWVVVGAGLGGIALSYFWWLRRSETKANVSAAVIAALMVAWCVVVWLSATASWASQGAFDPQPIATRITALRDAGRPVVFVDGRHHGAWHFAARLEEPLPRIRAEELSDWFAAHPDGVALVVVDHKRLRHGECLPWRSDWVCYRMAHQAPKPAASSSGKSPQP
ncbi:MAG TPA: hypothetical protein PKI22_01075 [Hydrogenophilus thermoluteolus]|nr:hypothetical protein [Rhodocyclaceae bacterium]HNQ47989.1 hypothetical protein [Hydrogenophilus thermoluteolus]HNU19552.1 hypothetical protein [Hydrogenophilus thermoluteolus]